MFNNILSNENLPDWVPLVAMIVVVAGYFFIYRPMLKREGRKEMGSRGFMDVMFEPVTENEEKLVKNLKGSGYEKKE